jgi:8-oxo-dGTP pyrophosphatase MutT (NUDIX family)
MDFLEDLDAAFDNLLCEGTDEDKYKAAVAVIQFRDKWLLGLGQGCGDGRTGKWCMVGGGIKPGETPLKAAVREAWEESGVRVKAIKLLPDERNKPHVAFVHCRADRADSSKLKPNHEFAAMGWFTGRDMVGLKLFSNVKKLIQKAKRS